MTPLINIVDFCDQPATSIWGKIIWFEPTCSQVFVPIFTKTIFTSTFCLITQDGFWRAAIFLGLLSHRQYLFTDWPVNQRRPESPSGASLNADSISVLFFYFLKYFSLIEPRLFDFELMFNKEPLHFGYVYSFNATLQTFPKRHFFSIFLCFFVLAAPYNVVSS